MISVIIPVYNTAQWLENLYDSLCRQTYSDLEIIFVDDGSSDNSVEILRGIEEKDSRVKVICQSNHGVSCARNRGYEASSGDYISFIDSDDTLEPDMYEYLLKLMTEYHAEISHCSYNKIIGTEVRHIGNSGEVIVQNPEEALECLVKCKLFVGSCWSKLFARSIIGDLRFREDVKVSEDWLMNYQLFSGAKTIVFSDVCKYNYISRDSSACNTTPSLKKAKDRIVIAEQLLEENKFDSMTPALNEWYLYKLFSYYKALKYNKFPSECDDVMRKIKNLNAQGYELSFSKRFSLWLLRYCFPLYRLLYDGFYNKIRKVNNDI